MNHISVEFVGGPLDGERRAIEMEENRSEIRSPYIARRPPPIPRLCDYFDPVAVISSMELLVYENTGKLTRDGFQLWEFVLWEEQNEDKPDRLFFDRTS